MIAAARARPHRSICDGFSESVSMGGRLAWIALPAYASTPGISNNVQPEMSQVPSGCFSME
jgi:hypothetical protein